MDNKYFSVEEMNNLIGNMELAFTDYSDKADTFISKCKQFQNDDSFMGEKATVVKDLVGDKEVDLVNAQKDVQAKLLAMYKHSVQSFAEKVDSAPNARLDLDTLDMVESDLKAIYEDVDTTCADIENIAKEMEAKYGHLGHITVPNANPLRESLEELCGGYNPESGSIYDLKQKFINWDEEECAYIDSNYLDGDIENINYKILEVNNMHDEPLNYGNKLFDSSDINTYRDAIISILKKQKIFSDNDLSILLDKCFNLLIMLYKAIIKNDTTIKEKLIDAMNKQLSSAKIHKETMDLLDAYGDITQEDHDYLLAISGESQTYEGFVAVTYLVINRAVNEDKKISEIVRQESQFDSFSEDKIGVVTNSEVERAINDIIDRKVDNPIKNCTYFFGRYPGNYNLWVENIDECGTIILIKGNVFYTNDDWSKVHNMDDSDLQYETSSLIIYDKVNGGGWLFNEDYEIIKE